MADSQTSGATADNERTVLLATKLEIPRPRPDYLVRSRLIAALDTGMARGLTLVCTPAGFGKTTLLADWATRARWPVAWLSLDAEDNDPARFWHYVAAALDHATRPTGARGQPFPEPWLSASSVDLAALISGLSALPGDLALVLDDYHLIESRSIHDRPGLPPLPPPPSAARIHRQQERPASASDPPSGREPDGGDTGGARSAAIDGRRISW